MTPFYGDKAKPRISAHTGNKNFSWVLDTGSAVTFMNINSFEITFGKILPEGGRLKINLFKKGKNAPTLSSSETSRVKIFWAWTLYKSTNCTTTMTHSKSASYSLKSHICSEEHNNSTFCGNSHTGKLIPEHLPKFEKRG
jgi:hypothetical protein